MSSPEELLDSACNDLNNTGINAAFEAAQKEFKKLRGELMARTRTSKASWDGTWSAAAQKV